MASSGPSNEFRNVAVKWRANVQILNAKFARAHGASLACLTMCFPLAAFAQDTLKAETLCGYTPHTHVTLLDRNWELYLPYPQPDPFRRVKFGPGFVVRFGEDVHCRGEIIAIGAGTITWGAVTIGIAENELTVNGKRVELKKSVRIDPDGNVIPDGVIVTPE